MGEPFHVKRRRKYVPVAIGRYWNSLPDCCVACGAPGTVPHHILANAPGKKGRRDDMLIARICPNCHNMGTVSVHLLGSEAAFERETGVDLVAIAVRNRDAWLKLEQSK